MIVSTVYCGKNHCLCFESGLRTRNQGLNPGLGSYQSMQNKLFPLLLFRGINRTNRWLGKMIRWYGRTLKRMLVTNVLKMEKERERVSSSCLEALSEFFPFFFCPVRKEYCD